MIIYNETGAEPVGLYYWDNTAPGTWLRVLNVSEKDTLGTDDQQIQTFGLNGSSLELDLEDLLDSME